jgi:hypothetical protein
MDGAEFKAYERFKQEAQFRSARPACYHVVNGRNDVTAQHVESSEAPIGHASDEGRSLIAAGRAIRAESQSSLRRPNMSVRAQ